MLYGKNQYYKELGNILKEKRFEQTGQLEKNFKEF
jgi:hypothetical protein